MNQPSTDNSTTTRLPSALQSSLTEIVERSQSRGANIQAILLSTTDGAPLGRGYCTLEDEDAVASIESTPHCKHMSLLGMGGIRQVMALYDHGSLIHVYQGAMVITILCAPQANLGAVRSMVIPLLLQVLEPFATKLASSLMQPGVADGGAVYYQ